MLPARMNGGSAPTPWSNVLRWLADLIQPSTRPTDAVSPPLVVSVRRLGAKLALALQLDQVEAVGIDMIHSAVNELLSMHVLPQAACLSVAGREEGGFAEDVVAGVARACRAHDIPITVQLATVSADEQVGITVSGIALESPPLVPQPGDVVLALRGTGPVDGDSMFLGAFAAEHGIPIERSLDNGDSVGRTLTAARASHASVMHRPIRDRWPFRAIAIDEGSLLERVRSSLPAGLDVEFDLSTLRPPAPFEEWFPGARRMDAANACTVGHDFVLFVRAADARRFESLFAAWNEPAARLGIVVAQAKTSH